MAGLSEVPVVIQEMTDSEMMELALIENLQREDLNPIEEALGYRELMDKHNLTQDPGCAKGWQIPSGGCKCAALAESPRQSHRYGARR